MIRTPELVSSSLAPQPLIDARLAQLSHAPQAVNDARFMDGHQAEILRSKLALLTQNGVSQEKAIALLSERTEFSPAEIRALLAPASVALAEDPTVIEKMATAWENFKSTASDVLSRVAEILGGTVERILSFSWEALKLAVKSLPLTLAVAVLLYMFFPAGIAAFSGMLHGVQMDLILEQIASVLGSTYAEVSAAATTMFSSMSDLANPAVTAAVGG